MKIPKKLKCVHCQDVIQGNTTCKCGTVSLVNETVVLGQLGKDYQDISAILLTE